MNKSTYKLLCAFKQHKIKAKENDRMSKHSRVLIVCITRNRKRQSDCVLFNKLIFLVIS